MTEGAVRRCAGREMVGDKVEMPKHKPRRKKRNGMMTVRRSVAKGTGRKTPVMIPIKVLLTLEDCGFIRGSTAGAAINASC